MKNQQRRQILALAGISALVLASITSGCGSGGSSTPNMPSGFTATARNATATVGAGANFTWADVSNETSYTVSVSNSATGPFTALVSVGADVTNAAASLGQGNFYFQLVAANGNKQSAPATFGPLSLPQ